MKEILMSFLKYFLVIAGFIVFLAIIFFFLTRKYNPKRRSMYAFFFSNTKRENLLISLAITNALFTYLFIIYSESTMIIMPYAYTFLILAFCIIGRKPKLIFFDIASTGVCALIVKIYEIALEYSYRIYNDKYVTILLVLFSGLAMIYSIVMCIKKIEIILSYRNIRRKKS